MRSRLLLATTTTAMLFGGAFVLRSTAPGESVEAVSSVPVPALERLGASVSVVTEVVTAQTITSAPLAKAASRSNVRTKPAQKRSLLARLLLGNGDTRPEPFPRPGRSLSARP